LNHGFTYTGIIDARAAGSAVLEHLATRYTHASAQEWRQRIEAGLVLLDRRPALAAELLRHGQTLSWVRPPWSEPAAPLGYGVLFEDEDLLAVDKPSGLPTLPGAQFLEHTLLHQVRLRAPGASPVHRLGRGTSGIVLFARTASAGAALGEALREHRMAKVYRAVLEGQPGADDFSVEVPIGPVPHRVLGTVNAATPGGKPARSHAHVIERRETTCLVEVRIETGRPHQIRIHMAAHGHPLVGDPLYASGGGVGADIAALPGDLGYALHATRLRFSHPRTGQLIDLESQPPPVLRALARSR
jgi:23S rRNA pseudouridine1911/1915/1917 synthase